MSLDGCHQAKHLRSLQETPASRPLATPGSATRMALRGGRHQPQRPARRYRGDSLHVRRLIRISSRFYRSPLRSLERRLAPRSRRSRHPTEPPPTFRGPHRHRRCRDSDSRMDALHPATLPRRLHCVGAGTNDGPSRRRQPARHQTRSPSPQERTPFVPFRRRTRPRLDDRAPGRTPASARRARPRRSPVSRSRAIGPNASGGRSHAHVRRSCDGQDDQRQGRRRMAARA